MEEEIASNMNYSDLEDSLTSKSDNNSQISKQKNNPISEK